MAEFRLSTVVAEVRDSWSPTDDDLNVLNVIADHIEEDGSPFIAEALRCGEAQVQFDDELGLPVDRHITAFRETIMRARTDPRLHALLSTLSVSPESICYTPLRRLPSGPWHDDVRTLCVREVNVDIQNVLRPSARDMPIYDLRPQHLVNVPRVPTGTIIQAQVIDIRGIEPGSALYIRESAFDLRLIARSAE